MADIPDVPKRSTLDNRWDLGVNGLYIHSIDMFYTGNYVGDVPAEKPNFSISSICNGGEKTAVYDASSAADFYNSQSRVLYGPINNGYVQTYATVYFPDLTITLAAP